MIIRRGAGQTLQLRQFALEFLFRFFGQIGFFKALAQNLDFRLFAIFFAEFLLNGAQLLLEQIVLLLFRHFVASG